jgi:hypothetical protein
VFGPAPGRVVILPLDEIENSLAQPFDVAFAPGLARIFVSASGADEVAVLDGRRVLAMAEAANATAIVNDLSVAASYIIARIPVGRNPRGLALSKDRKRLYVSKQARRYRDVHRYPAEQSCWNHPGGTIAGPDPGTARRAELLLRPLFPRTPIQLFELPSPTACPGIWSKTVSTWTS